MHLSHTAPSSSVATSLAARVSDPAPVDVAAVAQAVQMHTQFQLRQLQPTWLEACVSNHVAQLGGTDARSYVARLQREPALAERLLEMALQPPPWPADAVSLDTDLRAGTRGLLDGIARLRPPGRALDVWVLVPEGAALLAHLREHLLLLDPQAPALRLHGPRFLTQRIGDQADVDSDEDSPGASAAQDRGVAAPGDDVRQTLRWLDRRLPEGGTPAADLILASDLFTFWRPDLQRLWLSRLAGTLRNSGLLLLGRPKALWRAPRGLRALHVDGMHWLQRSRAAQDAPIGLSLTRTEPTAPRSLGALDAATAPTAPLPTAPLPITTTVSAPVAASDAVAAPALDSVGLLDIHLPERHVTLNATMRRLLGLADAQPIGWDTLLMRLSPSDRLRLQQLTSARIDMATPADAAGTAGTADTAGTAGTAELAGRLWTLCDPQPGDTGTARQLRMQCERLTDGQGRSRLTCLATDESARASLPAAPLPSNTPATRTVSRGALEVVTSLPGAAARHELELLYQPQLDVSRGHLRAVEALLRWNHPQLGLIEPRAFLPWAEECGLIVEIGRWTLQQACRQARHWRDIGLPAVPMAVNVSPAQLEAPDFIAQVEQALALAGLPASGLELELTESILLHESDRVRQHLAACRRLGVRIALDDFGTGQANLSRLHRLPLDKIKLDPSFIRHLNVDRGAQAIVRSVIGLGHQLGLAVVAEGVEQGQQLTQLGDARCDAYQGHLATPALGAETLTQRLLAQAAA